MIRPSFELKPQGDKLVGTLRDFIVVLEAHPPVWRFTLYHGKAQIAHGEGPQEGCLRQASKLVMREVPRKLGDPCIACGTPLYPAPPSRGPTKNKNWRCLNPDCERYRKRV